MIATPEMIAAAWASWHSRNGGRIGPGPGFVEAIEAAVAAGPDATIETLTRERDEAREALKSEPMDRSVQFQDGFRNAKRRCVAWLHTEAKRMNDPNAVAILNAAADHLGNSALAGGKQE